MSWVPPSWPERAHTLVGAALGLATVHDLDDVLGRIVAFAALVAGARYAALGIYEQGRIVRFIHDGLDAATVEGIGRLPEGRGLLGDVIVADGPIRLADLSTDPRSAGFPPHHPLMRSFLGVPLVRGGRRYGNLYVSERHDGQPFDDDDEALVVTLAAFAAGAMESTELVTATGRLAAAEERDRARREMLRSVIAAQEAERARVSRDLHDDVGQALTSVLLGLKLVEAGLNAEPVDVADARRHTAELRELVADALRRARRLAFDLRPTILDDIGLAAALARLADDIAGRHGLVVELATGGLETSVRLPAEVETVVYRVVQEALTNVVRHACAGRASVVVNAGAGRVRAIVEDDGSGFDTDAPHPGHLGLKGMNERAGLAGGTLQVLSALGEGTSVVLEVPVG